MILSEYKSLSRNNYFPALGINYYNPEALNKDNNGNNTIFSHRELTVQVNRAGGLLFYSCAEFDIMEYDKMVSGSICFGRDITFSTIASLRWEIM